MSMPEGPEKQAAIGQHQQLFGSGTQKAGEEYGFTWADDPNWRRPNLLDKKGKDTGQPDYEAQPPQIMVRTAKRGGTAEQVPIGGVVNAMQPATNSSGAMQQETARLSAFAQQNGMKVIMPVKGGLLVEKDGKQKVLPYGYQ